MSNMSYCMFENTATDFEDCVLALEDGKELCDRERGYAERLAELAERYLAAYADFCENEGEAEEDADY